MLYFAYGSNMDRVQMAIRCPNAVPIGTAELKGHKLIFRGVADVVPEGNTVNSTVKGVVWRITKKCLKELDIYEGYPSLYDRKAVTVWMNGRPVRTLVYYMVRGPVAPPSREYWKGILRGYFQFGIEPGEDMLKPNNNINEEEAEAFNYDYEYYWMPKPKQKERR